MLPTDTEIRALHERYAPTREAFDLVYTHCEIVCAVAEELLAGYGHPLDVDLVRAGSLLHDIGVYPLYSATGQLDQRHYIRHGMLGYDLLRELGYPEALCRFCSHHTGVGFNRDDVVRQKLPLPVDDYLADTDEERLVMYADAFHSKTTPPVFMTADAYAASMRRFGEDKVATFAEMVAQFGQPDLPGLARRYAHPVV